MKPSEPLKRGGPLKRTGIRQRRSRPPRGTKVSTDVVEFSSDTKAAARRRARDRCEAAGPTCTERIDQFHHRLPRSQGGKGWLANCLAVCSPCHHLIHHHVAWSYRHGLLVRRHRNPVGVTVHPGCEPVCEHDHTQQ